jgi:hypothetical protein
MALEEVRNKKIQLARGTLYDASISLWTGEYEGEVIELNKNFVVNKALLGRELEDDERDKLKKERALFTRLQTIIKEIKALKSEADIEAYKIVY